MKRILLISLCVIFALSGAYAQNEHWSRQFKEPASSTTMSSTTGMSNGIGAPSIRQVKWHDGKLWFSGSWAVTNSVRWSMWTWSPVDGWEAVTYHHTAQGGIGPLDAKINDFLWLPDGRLVVAGEFGSIDNLGGVRYRTVGSLAVYDKDEPTANKWKPLGDFQYNGSIGGGSIMKLAYDKQGKDLYMVGTFGGIPGQPGSPGIHKYNFETKSYVPLKGGIYKSGGLKSINAIYIDETTSPSTIYVGGVFQWVGGNGVNPNGGGTSILADGVASYQEGRDGGFGWRSYPELKKATGFISTSIKVNTIAIINGELWIGGAFEDPSNPNVRGIAKWDENANKWVDPTGKGGVGRDVIQMAQADNGKVYFAGAFGGRNGGSTFYDGFKNGEDAHMAISYDPATNTWEQLGEGLYSIVMPECRLTVHGNDVYYAGDFTHFGSEATENESYFIAHWNENINFSQTPVITAEKTLPGTLTVNVNGGSGTWQYSLNDGAAQSNNKFTGLGYGKHKITVTNGTYSEDIYAEFKAPTEEVAIGGDQNIHWSRRFTDPSHNGGVMGVNTGMKDGIGKPSPSCLAWHEDVLYFSGSWEEDMGERWFMWTWDKTNGWNKLAWKKGATTVGIGSPPKGFKWHDGKLYVYGSMEDFSGLAVYDPTNDTWSSFKGTYNGHNVEGVGSSNGGGVIHDLEWDKDGNMYFVGNWSWDNTIFPSNLASAVRVTPSGEYQPLGKAMHPYKPGRPLSINAILIDETQTPADLYIGGTFRYIKGDIHSTKQAYNVAKWNHTDNDWESMGEDSDANHLPGLPAMTFLGFEFNGEYPVVRDLIMDKNGVLYAAGSLALFDDNPIVKDRNEHFGIVKFDKAANKWVGVVDCGGVSRDIYQMSWLDDNTLLLSGSFNHANDFTYLGNAAKLDITTGKLTGFGGGLRRGSLGQLFGSTVRHAVNGNEIYFFGDFDHAGVNANSNIEAPNSSNYIAMWDGTKNLDPNDGLEAERLIIAAVSNKYSSENVDVDFKAWGAATGSTYEWFKWSSSKYVQEQTGAEVSMTLRGKPGDEMYRYVAVRNSEGILGGKLKVTVRFIHKDEFTDSVPYIIYNETAQKLSSSLAGTSYEWYKNGTKLNSNTRSIASQGSGSYTVIVVSGQYKSQESLAYILSGVNTKPVANAGDDQTVKEGTVVTLDGTKSSDADGDAITYKWTAPNGITLNDATAAKPTFTAPNVNSATDYTFSLVVNDGTADSQADEVVITVEPKGTGIEKLEVGKIIVYPNPVKDHCIIKLDCNTSSYYKISVINSAGQTISILSNKDLPSGVHTLNWDATSVQKGIYFVKVENKKGSIVHRVIVK